MPPVGSILSIGDELALGEALDTNGPWLAARLAAGAIQPREHRTVADDRAAIAAAMQALAGSSDVLLVTGGLGPTDDDLTRQALGDLLDPGRPLVTDEAAVAQLQQWFRHRRRPMAPSNRVQAQRPPSAEMLPNPHGTAPGLAGRIGGCMVFCLPGPPREMEPMYADHVRPRLPEAGDTVMLARQVHEFGLGESNAARLLCDLTRRGRHPTVGLTVSGGVVTAGIRGRGPRASITGELEELAGRIETAWAPYAFGRDEETLGGAVGQLLRQAGARLATAESCTGGWLSKLVVDTPGSSAYHLGGWVTYADAMKESCLGVPGPVLTVHGAVSEPVAEAMAVGALRASGAECSLSITGIAGPDGGTADKPVGTVFIGVGRRTDGTERARVRRLLIRADRATVRRRSAMAALQLLRFDLLGVPDETLLPWEVQVAPPGDRSC